MDNRRFSYPLRIASIALLDFTLPACVSLGGARQVTAKPVAEDWAVYLTELNGMPASIIVDLALLPRDTRPPLPWHLWADFKMRTPDSHGMGDAAEADRLNLVEDAIIGLAAERLGARETGHVRSGGHWQVHLQAKSRDGFEAIVAAAAMKVPGLEYTLSAEEDPKWRYFDEQIAPDAERYQWIQDSLVVENVRKYGDPLTTPREISHWAYFPTAADRAAFISAVERNGFRNAGTMDDAKDELPFGVEFVRTDSAKLETIHTVVMSLVELAAAMHGDYTGWESIVVKEGKASKTH